MNTIKDRRLIKEGNAVTCNATKKIPFVSYSREIICYSDSQHYSTHHLRDTSDHPQKFKPSQMSGSTIPTFHSKSETKGNSPKSARQRITVTVAVLAPGQGLSQHIDISAIIYRCIESSGRAIK